jgi:hypothetical protein
MGYKVQINDLVRDANEEETAALDLVAAQVEAEAQAEADRKALKEATLAKLGLTADEAAALLS